MAKPNADLATNILTMPADRAIALLRAAVIKEPTLPRHCANLAVLHSRFEQGAIAVTQFGRAIILDASAVQAHRKFAKQLFIEKRFHEAEIVACRALILAPEDSETNRLLSLSHMERADFKSALVACERARIASPLNDQALALLGAIHLERYNFGDARSVLRRALMIRPNFTAAMKNLGSVSSAVDTVDEMDIFSARLTAAIPLSAHAWVIRSRALTRLYKIAPALACLDRASSLSATKGHVYHSSKIYLHDHQDDCTFREEQAVRKEWWDRYGKAVKQSTVAFQNSKTRDRRLVIGYISPNFCNHSAGELFEELILGHDGDRFKVILYSNHEHEDERTRHFRASADEWREVRDLSDDEVACLVREDRVDILVDLASHTTGNNLLAFARKPAPVQISAWGYALGTGLPTIDYFLADRVCVPTDERHHFAETCFDLPCILPFHKPANAPRVDGDKHSKPRDIIFGSLNRFEKFTPRVMDLWARVLKSVPNARFLFKTAAFEQRNMRDRIIAEFDARGIGSNQLIFRGKTTRFDHLNTYNEIDIQLDTIPQTGGLTSWESLYMGTPIITLTGPNTSHRITHSILEHVGLSNWVARSEDDYVAKAVVASRDIASLAVLSRELRDRVTGSVGGDIPRYRAYVERAYIEMWRRWCASDDLPAQGSVP